MRYEVGYSVVGPSAEALEVGGRYGEEFGGRPSLVDCEVRGRIGGEEVREGELGPTVWVDGAPVAWTTLGEMLTSFAGWQFHLRLDG